MEKRGIVGLRTIALVIVGALFAMSLAVSGVRAEGEGPVITSESVESQFPDGVLFKATASGPDPIERVRVFLKTLGSDNGSYGQLDISPGTEVAGEYVLRTSTSTQHVPPGTLIRYSYELRDSAGRVVRTPEREVVYQDNRFEWFQVSDGPVTVYYYGGTIAEFVKKRAEIILDAALQTKDNMGPLLGIDDLGPIRIVFYNNYRDMSSALPFRSQAVRQDLLTQGQAFPEERVLLVLGNDTTVTGITSHELTHILVREAAGQGTARVPSWLNEGLAEYGNIDPGEGYTQALLEGIYTRKIKPLWYLSAFGGEPEDIIIAYGQSSSVVRYLIAFYGPEKIAELMAAMQGGTRSIDDALELVYGFDQYELDTEWRRQIGLQPLDRPGEVQSPQASLPTTVPQIANPTPEASSQKPPSRSGAGCNLRRSNEQVSLPLGIILLGFVVGPLVLWRHRRGR